MSVHFEWVVNFGQVVTATLTIVTIVGTAVAAWVRVKVEIHKLRADVNAALDKIGEIVGPAPGLPARVGILEHDLANIQERAVWRHAADK